MHFKGWVWWSLESKYPFLGVAAVILPYALIGISVVLSPRFSWLNNALSDLGNTSNTLNTSSGTAYFFNSGLILSGILGTLFCAFLLRDERFSWKFAVWAVPLALGTMDLAMIGIFNESFGYIHLVVSVIFFFLTAVTLLLFSYVSFPLGRPKTGAIALSLGILCATVWLTRFPWQGVAIQETVTSLSTSALVFLVAVDRIRKPKSTESATARQQFWQSRSASDS